VQQESGMLNEHNTHRSHFFLRQIRARPRLIFAITLAIAAYALLPIFITLHTTTRALIAWNAGVYLYLLLAAVMMIKSTHEHMRARARLENEGKWVVMGGTILATSACLIAIFFDLSNARNVQGVLRHAHVALAIATVISSWLFIHLMFALNYAHVFYSHSGEQLHHGLQFPDTTQPDYFDFLYFSYIIGTSGQTADVSITSKTLRRTGLAHCVLAYAFNTTVLALAINLAAGLL
jgi:uncharacterized membrane protein